jgi:DNA-binding GntR family transcriptional regulator
MDPYGPIWIPRIRSLTCGFLTLPYVEVDHESAVPLYVQVAGILRGRIESGELRSRVPSLKSISQEFGVSHVTAEKAVQVLKDEGLVEVVIGKGTYVRKQ